ncbi:MAG: S41 family peptidase [Gemmatimonadales bacterium]
MKGRLGLAGLLLVALASFFGGGWLLRRGLDRSDRGRRAPAESPVMGSRLFQEVMRHVRSYAVDSLDESAIYRLAASGMLDELNDPYAALTAGDDDPNEVGEPPLGMYLDVLEGYVVVVAVRPGSPAAAAGVRSGDVILSANGAAVAAHGLGDLANALARPEATPASLRIVRGGGRAIRVTVPTGTVPAQPEPTAFALGEGVVQIRPAGLGRVALARVATLADSAARAGARGLVLDLRDLVDGRLEDGVALASVFVPAGTVVAVRRGRQSGDSTPVRTDRDGSVLETPLVVLVDQGTAGAAEVAAGALQDLDRALIVGEPSFGRGSELSVFPLGDGSALRLTTAHWTTPVGRHLQRGLPTGTEDDEEAEESPERPTFRSAGGRVLRGGGGVVPDREVARVRGEAGGEDAVLALARSLLVKAASTEALLALEP